MKEMIKKYRGSLICSFLVMLIGVLVGFTSTQSMWANVFFVVTNCALVAIIFYDNRNLYADFAMQHTPGVSGRCMELVCRGMGSCGICLRIYGNRPPQIQSIIHDMLYFNGLVHNVCA